MNENDRIGIIRKCPPFWENVIFSSLSPGAKQKHDAVPREAKRSRNLMELIELTFHGSDGGSR